MAMRKAAPPYPSFFKCALANYVGFDLQQSLICLRVIIHSNNSLQRIRSLTLRGSFGLEGRAGTAVYCRSGVRSPLRLILRFKIPLRIGRLRSGADGSFYKTARERRRDSMALRPLSHTLLPPRRWLALSSLLWYGTRQTMDGKRSDSRF
jgi:hypothetical protein